MSGNGGENSWKEPGSLYGHKSCNLDHAHQDLHYKKEHLCYLGHCTPRSLLQQHGTVWPMDYVTPYILTGMQSSGATELFPSIEGTTGKPKVAGAQSWKRFEACPGQCESVVGASFHNLKVVSLIPSQGTYLGCNWSLVRVRVCATPSPSIDPKSGSIWKQIADASLFSLFLSLSLHPLSQKVNENVLGWRFTKKKDKRPHPSPTKESRGKPSERLCGINFLGTSCSSWCWES